MAGGGAPGMKPDEPGMPSRSSRALRFPGAWSWLWAAQRTAQEEAFPEPLGTSKASDSGDAPLEKHFQQAELSGNILFLKGSPKL